MLFTSTFLSTLPLFLSVAVSKQIPIDVGESGLVFNPNNVQAAQGDQLVFTFYPQAHSVSQSSFAAPCQPLANGFNSGIVPVSSGKGGTFTVTVNDTKPIWVYCAQTKKAHCQSGMVMVVNQPTSGPNTLDAYKAAAAKTGNSTIAPAVQGGILASNSTSSGNGSVTTGSPTGTATGGSTSSTSVATGGAASLGVGTAQVLALGGAAVLGGLLL